MLTLENISFAYQQKAVLNGITLRLEDGLVHGILGPNGSGKTTLFNVIAGRLQQDEGDIRYHDRRISTDMIGYLETNLFFYSLMTGREYLELHARGNNDFPISKWNDIFNLPLDHLIESYSSGMKKKLAIMGHIGLDRPIMLLDEPFNNLDLEANQFLAALIRMLAKKGKLIFLSSHFMEVITTVCDRVQVLQKGTITEMVQREEFDEWKGQHRFSQIEAAKKQARKLL